jgi:thiamine-monophosphate kinase
MTNSSSEFDLIAEFFAPLANAPGAFGLKDDAAIVAPRAGHDLVVTTDTIVAGVDFFADDPAHTVARKALRVNLSDLAAKGAQPFAYLLTLLLPQADPAWLGEFARGLRDDQEAFGCGLLGGDLSAAPGPLSVSITAFGHVPAGGMILRSGARPGDGVFVTGTIGDGGGGLSLLRDAQAALAAEFHDALIERYRVPQPPIGFGPPLRALATAALDVSDGLLADLGHLAGASRVLIAVEGSLIPRSPALRALWGDGEEAVVRAATAGDDYQIVFTAPMSKEPAIAQAARDAGATQVTRIGLVKQGSGVALLDAHDREIAVPRKGFAHF